MTGLPKLQRDIIARAILEACRDQSLTMTEMINNIRLPGQQQLKLDACQRHVKRLKDQGKIAQSGLIPRGHGWAPFYQTVKERP
jgi:hypothetical protein